MFIPIMITDVNGDGKPDLVVVSQTDKNYGNGLVGVLLGNGEGTFRPVVTYDSGGFAAFSAVLADVNGDGKSDLIVLNCGPSGSTDCPSNGGTVGVLLANGDGTFQPVKTSSRGGLGGVFSPLTVADVNRDGKPDILVGNNCPGNCTGDGSFAVLLGNGDGTFQELQTFALGGSQYSWATVADVNGDRTPDLLSANWCSSLCSGEEGAVGVLLNNTADTTPPVITVSATPKVLWPPNGKMVPVTVSGTITDTGSGVNVNSATYAVKDEYGEVQPHGAITLGPEGAYSFTILLQASRLGSDLDGRRYAVTVRAKDNAGNGGSKARVVTVPHDQGD
jgi:FG-GAP-like repeat